MKKCALTLIAALVAASCGSTAPSAQLLDARKAYARAEQSHARELSPDKLLDAKQALARAESENDSDAGSTEEKHLAYLAERKALAAVAFADLEKAERERIEADKQYREELERSAAASKREREKTERELADVRNKLENTAGEVDAKTKELKEREKQLSEKQKALEAERQKRLEAEERARAAIASLEEIARVKEEQRGIVITLSGAVLFKSDEEELLPIAKNKLDAVAAALLETDERRQIVVEGHTDSRGSDTYNRKLSLARAESVRSYLVERGVPSNRISAAGRGEDQPVANNRDAEGRANNRRVEIVVKPL